MGQNLTSLPISSSFQYLLQISGSDQVTDGTGSLITALDISASYATNAGNANFATTATSASYATNASSSLYAVNASTADSASVSTTATSASYATTASYAENVTTPNLQQVTDEGATTTNAISGPRINLGGSGTNGVVNVYDTSDNEIFRATATGVQIGGLSQDYDLSQYGDTNQTGNVNVTGAVTASAGFKGDLDGNAATATSASHADNAISASYAVNASSATSASYATNASTADSATTATTASHADIAADLMSNANINISSISASNASFTSASIGYLTSVTGSATYIGDAFIVVNTDTPTQRYAGIKVVDSGSATPTDYTASLFYDSVTNDWNYEYSGSDPTNFGVVMFGPEYATQGSPAYLSNNTIPKGDGGHHLNDSNITDDGSVVGITAELDVTGGVTASAGFVGDLTGNANTATSASYATNASTADSATTATSASYATNATTADSATSASHADNASTAVSATSASYALSASYAPVEGFPYTGSAGILGDLNIDISGASLAVTISSGSFTGSLVDNIVPTSSITQSQVNHIVTLNQETYDALSGSYDDNTFYIISDATGSITDNLIVTGSIRGNVESVTVASSTASFDLSLASFFETTITAGATTHFTATNINPGQTVNIKVNIPQTSSLISFADEFKFPSGSNYNGSGVADAVDIVSFISFDSATLYANAIENLI